MTKKEKLIERFQRLPKDFHYEETVRLLRIYGFEEVATGKTSGSRVRFINNKNLTITLHKPHPSGIMKKYQLKQIKNFLEI